MYENFWHEYYCPNMSRDVYDTVQHCQYCANLGRKFKHHRQLQLFPPSSRLQFFARDIACWLPQRSSGNQFVVIVSDRYSKLASTVPTANTSLTHVSYLSFNRWEVFLSNSRHCHTKKSANDLSVQFFYLCAVILALKEQSWPYTISRQTDKWNTTTGRSYRNFDCTSLWHKEI